MSTRCHIVIKKEGFDRMYVYHHCDGYPSGVGADLVDMLKDYKFNDWTPSALARYIEDTDSGYEIDTDIHGDEDYIYEINCDNMTLKCYSADYYDEEVDDNEDAIEIPGNMDFSVYNTSPEPVSTTKMSIYFDTLVRISCAILSNPSYAGLDENAVLMKALTMTLNLYNHINDMENISNLDKDNNTNQ